MNLPQDDYGVHSKTLWVYVTGRMVNRAGVSVGAQRGSRRCVQKTSPPSTIPRATPAAPASTPPSATMYAVIVHSTHNYHGIRQIYDCLPQHKVLIKVREFRLFNFR